MAHWRGGTIAREAKALTTSAWWWFRDESPQDECRLLWMMGWETGNVHLGNPRQRDAIRRDLRKRKGDWLSRAARSMRNATLEDWHDWRNR